MTERMTSDDVRAQASAQMAARVARRRGEAAGAPENADDAHERGGRAKGSKDFLGQNKAYILSSVVVAVIVAVLVVVVGAVMSGCAAEKPKEASLAYQSPYDWSKLDRSGDRYAYVVNGTVKSRLGVDVSENQHDIDWQAVAGDGIDFAMVRVGYRGATAGDLYLDEQYWANLDGARAAGLDCGVYFFSQAQTVDEAVEEADYVLTYLNGTPLEYPVAFDSEEVVMDLETSRTTGLSNDQMTTIAQAFCRRIEQAGYHAMVYGNGKDMARYNYEGISAYPAWWAEYDAFAPAHNLDIAMWQYTNAGEVAGIPTAVDLNIDLSRVFD